MKTGISLVLSLALLSPLGALAWDGDDASCRLRSEDELSRAETRVVRARSALRAAVARQGAPVLGRTYDMGLVAINALHRRRGTRILEERRFLNALTGAARLQLAGADEVERRDAILEAIQGVRSATFPIFSHHQCLFRRARAARAAAARLGEQPIVEGGSPVDTAEVACESAEGVVDCALAASEAARGGEPVQLTAPESADRGLRLDVELDFGAPADVAPVEAAAESAAET